MSKKKTNKKPKKRIWELDVLKGIAFLLMVWDHTVFDLSDIFGVDTSSLGLFQEWPGYVSAGIFMVLCGVSVTLGRRNVRHGLQVFGLGAALTAGTAIAEKVLNADLLIWFGILHFLGLAMIIGHFVKKLPNPVLALLSVASFGIGLWFDSLTVSVPFLFPLGLTASGFSSADYFPLFPNLAYVFAGIFIGKTVYKKRKTLLKRKPPKSDFLPFLGRNTLVLYFVHQPIVVALLFIALKIVLF